ncbi:MAG: TatD family hydrolase, partial [Bacteroidota bacterium]|nr:TatD family hydrolase [Bacteroidota bacterium]
EYYGERHTDTGFGQFHCFSGNSDQMKRAVSLGFCVSYTGNITYKNTTLTDVVRETPEDRILIETDSPYLAPVPNRGKRNSPVFLGLIAQKIAELKKKDVHEIMTLTTNNARRLFALSMLVMTMFLFSSQNTFAQPGSKPPDSVLTKERREAEEIIKKQRDELMRAQEERRRDSIKAVQQEQEQLMREAMEQARKDSIRAVEKMADEERLRERAKTPIVWKAIGIGAGLGVGNLSGVNQGLRLSLTPTSVLATSFSIGTAITRGIDFEISYNSFTFGDDLSKDGLFRASESSPPAHLDTNKIPTHYFVPTHEDMSTKYLSFDFRFVINPRSPVKFYMGLGYMHVTITNSQDYYSVDSVAGGVVKGPSANLEHSFSRGGIKGLIGARYDWELGDNFILTPFVQIGAAFLFTGEQQAGGFDFNTTGDPIVFTHLNAGVTLYFGWFGVQRYK